MITKKDTVDDDDDDKNNNNNNNDNSYNNEGTKLAKVVFSWALKLYVG